MIFARCEAATHWHVELAQAVDNGQGIIVWRLHHHILDRARDLKCMFVSLLGRASSTEHVTITVYHVEKRSDCLAFVGPVKLHELGCSAFFYVCVPSD